MTWILRIFWYFAAQYLRGQMVLRAKRKGIVAYIRALQGARRFLIGLVLGFFVFHFIVLAGFGALVTGAFLLNLDQRTTLIILCSVFSAIFFIPVVALMILLSERFWYKASGAEKMVDDLTHRSDVDAA